jgi:hypothetical protein
MRSLVNGVCIKWLYFVAGAETFALLLRAPYDDASCAFLFLDRRRRVSAQGGLIGCYWLVEVAPEFRLHYSGRQK